MLFLKKFDQEKKKVELLVPFNCNAMKLLNDYKERFAHIAGI
jgi:hypothetical protein